MSINKMQWIIHDTILIGNPQEYKINSNCACFDLDGTIIKTKSGSKFMSDKDDWKFASKNVSDKLCELNNKKFSIVIFTNQAGIKLFGIENWKGMIENIKTQLKINIHVYAAMDYDLYRKPFPTMMNIFVKKENIMIHNDSFYCGDACGRTDDFSDSDYKFALNCNLKFVTPENLFDGCKIFEYPQLLYKIDFRKYVRNQEFKYISMEKEIVILVGNYASGKTYFRRKYITNKDNAGNYIIVTNNISYEDIVKIIEFGKSIIVDDTNLKKNGRKKFIETAKHFGYSCRCVNFICPVSVSIHNSRYRHFASNGKKRMMSDTVLGQYKNDFECPTIEEGFNEIIKYNFSIDKNYVDLTKYMLFLF